MGSGGGGSASGAVTYPAYMQTWHQSLLWGTNTVAAFAPDVTVMDALNTAMTEQSPYAGFVWAQASDVFLGTGKTIADIASANYYFEQYLNLDLLALATSYQSQSGAAAMLENFSSPTSALASYLGIDVNTLLSSYRGLSLLNIFLADLQNVLTNIAKAEADLAESELETEQLPAFYKGMREINAVMSTAFVIGESNIRSKLAQQLTREDAARRTEMLKVHADLTLKSEEIVDKLAVSAMEIYKEQAVTQTTLELDIFKIQSTIQLQIEELSLKFAAQRIMSGRESAVSVTEFNKVYMAAANNVNESELDCAEKNQLWQLRCLQNAGNFLGSIAGSATSQGYPNPPKWMQFASTAFSGLGAAGGLLGGIGALL